MGAGRVYQRTTPYPATAVGTVDFTQSADILYTVHINYPPQKLVRYGHTDWRWMAMAFGPVITVPVGTTTTVVKPNNVEYHAQTYEYVVTRISSGTPVQESRASTTVTAINDMSLSGNYNQINLPALGGAARHVIYRKQAGTFGYIGNTVDAFFRDENLIPVLAEAPPEGYNPFNTSGYYPSSIAGHQGRLFFGGTRTVINGIWATRSAEPENMDKSRPVRADDSLLFALTSEQVNAVSYLVSMDDLLVFSTDSVWSVAGGGDSNAITASSIVPKRQTGRGAARIKPEVVDTVVFYPTSKGRAVRALGFSFDISGYKSDNVSIFAPHLFKSATLKRMAFQEDPFGCLWCVRDDGKLLAFAWEQEQSVWGWSLCDTSGTVEDVATITEDRFDRVYMIISRTINGVPRRFLERLALPHETSITQACHLDCAITQSFSPAANIIDGLWHLEGATVTATYDGFEAKGLVVTNGKVTLPNGNTGSIVSVGLPYEGTLETLPAALTTAQGSAHVNRQEIVDVVVRAVDTKGISIGVSGAPLEQVWPEDGNDVSGELDISAIDYRVPSPGDWKDTSTVVVKQTEPFPAHIVGIFPKMRVSGD